MAALCQEDVDVDGVDKGSRDQSACSMSCTRMLIEFYKGNRILWDKTHKEYGNKTKTNSLDAPRGKLPEGMSTENTERDQKTLAWSEELCSMVFKEVGP